MPPATVYRHVAALAHAGVQEVTAERPVRVTVEHNFHIRRDATLIEGGARAAMTRYDHRKAVSFFVPDKSAAGTEEGSGEASGHQRRPR